MFTCMFGRYVASSVLLHPSEGADSVGGQLRGYKGYPFNGITNSGRVFEEGAGKRCSESNSKHWFTTSFLQITAVSSYAIGSRKLSANEQFVVVVVVVFVGAQTVVSLLQTTKIKQGMSFIAPNEVYTRTNKTPIV